ncbi:MAG: CDP-alcohol phosphatidyltransferase family protein [Ruminococcaceae bacterium]|nr:CDP-alcohol phosphatidyltransferase family protein [Oscillospiraceae bacterium]
MEWNKEKKVDFKYIFTIPNILSYLRIVLIAPFMVMFLQKKYEIAAGLIILSGLTDCIDGFLARRLNQITQLGKMLDPVADKLTLIAVAICLSVMKPIIIPVIAILTVKDLLMLIGASVLLKKHIMPVASAWYGKLGTICFYISIAVIVVFELYLGYENFTVISFILLSVTAVIMLYSLIRYYLIFRALINEHNKESANNNSVAE